jgi:nucleotide-binding universal stress UspA family protein
MPFPNQCILVVANETATAQELHNAVRAFAVDPAARVLVVTPAVNSRMRHWYSDSDVAQAAAEARLALCVARLSDLGLDVDGHVGDEDPLQAIADALRRFYATELMIATHPEARSNWLTRDLVGRALLCFGLPTVHVVVDGTPPREPSRGLRRPGQRTEVVGQEGTPAKIRRLADTADGPFLLT